MGGVAVTDSKGCAKNSKAASSRSTPKELLEQTLFHDGTSLVEAGIPVDLRLTVTQAVADFLQRVPRHVRAAVAGTGLAAGLHQPRNRHIAVLRSGLLQRV